VRSPGRRSWRPGWHPSSLAWCAWRPVRCSTAAHGTNRRGSMGSRRLRRAPQQQPCCNRSPFLCCCVWVSGSNKSSGHSCLLYSFKFAMPVGWSLMRTETVMVGFGFGTWEHGSNWRMHLLGSRWSVVGNCHDANKKISANKNAPPPASG
jgi:hypothetical protein